MINNRQAGRRRGRGGGNNGQRQGSQGNGSRIDNRARGNASQLHEKYKNMAADAQRAGDRVNTEYYLQFADHYFRVLSEQRGRFEEQRPRRDEYDGDETEEYGDEGEPVRARDGWGDGEQSRFQRDGGEQPRYARDGERGRDGRDGGDREDRSRDDRQQRDERPREFRRDPADREGGDAPRRNGNGDGRSQPRGEWQDRGERQERPERNRADRGDRRPAEGNAETGGQHRADAIAPGESLNGRAEAVMDADRPLDPPARRRGRPRREEAPVEANGDTTGAANGFEADRLPPSLGVSLTQAANDEDAAPKPRRRRARPADEAPTAAE